MVEAPNVVNKIFFTYIISFGSSIAFLFVAFMIHVVDPSTPLIPIAVLGFNITASIFLILVMIPSGIVLFFLLVGYSIIAPFLAPLVNSILDWFFGTLSNIFQTTYISRTILPSTINIPSTMTVYINFLNSTKGFLIDLAGLSAYNVW